jgi:hypothetical protein
MIRRLRNFFVILFVFLCEVQCVIAQVPYETKIDSASLIRYKRDKVMASYWLEQKYDSVTGIIPRNAPVDTVGYNRFDREGRRVESWKYDDKHVRRYQRWYYDSLGRVAKRVRTNEDSTDGYVDYWSYNSAGQVIREDVFKIGKKTTEQLFYSTYKYDPAGRLTVERQFYMNNEGNAYLHEHSDYYYNDSGLQILKITTDRNSDSLFIDSTFYFGNKNNYAEHGYLWRANSSGQQGWNLFSLQRASRDTVNGLETSVYYFCTYDMVTGKPEDVMADTVVCYSDRRTVEDRDDTLILKYTYTKNNKLLYWIIYNRQNQPLKKCTVSIIRYE